MPTNKYSISDARKNLPQLLVCINHGEEILIMRGDDAYARIGPSEWGKTSRHSDFCANVVSRTNCSMLRRVGMQSMLATKPAGSTNENIR